jgi:hypothetical protein
MGADPTITAALRAVSREMAREVEVTLRDYRKEGAMASDVQEAAIKGVVSVAFARLAKAMEAARDAAR